MALIFVSHASTDDVDVTRVSEWLSENSFNNHFVDHLHIPGGTDWNQALPIELGNAKIMVLYVTDNWLKSIECFSEYRAAYYGSRPVIPLLIKGQLENLSKDEERRLEVLRNSVHGIPVQSIPLDTNAKQELHNSIIISQRDLKRQARTKTVKLALPFLAVFTMILAGLSIYFRDYLGAYIDKLRIAKEYRMITAEQFPDVSNVDLYSRTFIECSSITFCPEMIVLPSGSFKLGTVFEDPTATSVELPNHVIEVPSLAVSISEVTRSQWQKCFISTKLEDGSGCKEIVYWKGQDDYPVDSISWLDTQAYLAWLNQQIVGVTDGPYRLLSEAEWEYAARGITSSEQHHFVYSWGDDLENACLYANGLNAEMPDHFAINRPSLDCPENATLAAETGSYLPNKFGLDDTAGNLAEWVEDCWHDSHGPLGSRDFRAWTKGSPPSCDRVIKGGSWFGNIDNLRVAARGSLNEELFGFNIGFRIARDLNWKPSE